MNQNFSQSKEKALLSAKKAQGTIVKVQEMIKEDKYCPDVIQQVDAVIGLLRSVKKHLLVGHIDHCLMYQLEKDKDQAIAELLKIYNLGDK